MARAIEDIERDIRGLSVGAKAALCRQLMEELNLEPAEPDALAREVDVATARTLSALRGMVVQLEGLEVRLLRARQAARKESPDCGETWPFPLTPEIEALW